MSLQNILKNKKCFKLVCGAGNEDAIEVEKLVALYAKAGANYFDLSARKDVVLAAKRGLSQVISEDQRSNYYFNVSVGMKGDPHVSKAFINDEKCIKCGKCFDVCVIQSAINQENQEYAVIRSKCIGCGKCIELCPVSAIEYQSENTPLQKVLPELIDMGLDSIELHAVTDDEEGSFEQWQIISSMYDGVLSLCLDRSHLGDKYLIARITRFLEGRKPYTTIIQADGAPMSGSDDKERTTLQALATADVVEKENFPVFLMLSGGTNSKTAKLAKIFDIPAHGVALGSYARKIVKQYIDRDDFLTNQEVFNKALIIAKELVDNSLNYMGT